MSALSLVVTKTPSVVPFYWNGETYLAFPYQIYTQGLVAHQAGREYGTAVR